MKRPLINVNVALAYGTFVADAYLALATLANRAGVQNLPPFGSGRGTGTGRFLTLLVATWTAALAVSCLRAQTTAGKSSGVTYYWFILVLVIAWFAFLLPLGAALFDYLWQVVVL